eukprot:2110893-Lingulodinium_polyedra.AAC.1
MHAKTCFENAAHRCGQIGPRRLVHRTLASCAYSAQTCNLRAAGRDASSRPHRCATFANDAQRC